MKDNRVNTGYSAQQLLQILGREEHDIDLINSGESLNDKNVLITGAAGSIGSALSRAVAAVSPASLTIVDHDEYGLFSIRNAIDELQPRLKLNVRLADVRDARRIRNIFVEDQPEVVFHVAALKHVGMVQENPAEGAATNVLGTRNVADAAQVTGVQAMVLVSTDKAVNPRNVMGATKKLAELVCRNRDLQQDTPTRFVVVRFGNVFGSSGSVVPIFQRQISRRQRITITDPRAERYFMTEREAVALLLEALQLGLNESNGRGGVYLQDMGLRVNIADLAKRMIRAAGLVPEVDIPVVQTRLRPGEKAIENLHERGEVVSSTSNANISLATSRFDPKELESSLIGLESACRLGDESAAMDILSQWMDLQEEVEPMPETSEQNVLQLHARK